MTASGYYQMKQQSTETLQTSSDNHHSIDLQELGGKITYARGRLLDLFHQSFDRLSLLRIKISLYVL